MKRWQILCLTMPGRELFLRRLLDTLTAQIEPFHYGVDLEIMVSNPHLSLGENRQRLLDCTSAEYVSWVDDDDLVSPDYVHFIYPLLNKDYVGFQLQMYMDRVKSKPTYHSLRYSGWSEDSAGYYRDISHLNPIRRELAMQARFEGGVGEDSRWSDRLRTLGCVRTEHYIPKPMYYYFVRSDRSAQAPEPWTSIVASGEPGTGSV